MDVGGLPQAVIAMGTVSHYELVPPNATPHRENTPSCAIMSAYRRLIDYIDPLSPSTLKLSIHRPAQTETFGQWFTGGSELCGQVGAFPGSHKTFNASFASSSSIKRRAWPVAGAQCNVSGRCAAFALRQLDRWADERRAVDVGCVPAGEWSLP